MVALFLDGEYIADIDKETLLLQKIGVGSELSEEDLAQLIRRSNEKRAKEKALYLLGIRDYSRKELVDKIRQETSDEAAELAERRMQELGLLNDHNFAQKYAKDLLFRKNHSASKAEFELIKKGIDKDLAREVIEALQPDAKESILRVLAGRKYSNLLRQGESGVKKAVASLQRLGYRWEDIRAALRQHELTHDGEADIYDVL